MEVVESESGESRVYRVLKDDDGKHYCVGCYRPEPTRIGFYVMFWSEVRKAWTNMGESTAPVELLQHISEVTIQAQAKWGLNKRFVLRGGIWSNKKAVREASGPPGTIERFAAMAAEMSRFGNSLR